MAMMGLIKAFPISLLDVLMYKFEVCVDDVGFLVFK